MTFNFENYLLQELNSDKIVVLKEQLFAKYGELEPDKIYIVTKYLTSAIEFGAETQPVQILILSEQNGMEEARDLFEGFAQTHNWLRIYQNHTFIKQQYSSPVVMSNFNEAAYGYRSILYVSANLTIMENVSDAENIKINGIDIQPLVFNWSYQMSGNTQPTGNELIASTVKNISTFSASMQIPILNTYKHPDITSGQRTVSSSDNHITVAKKNGYTITATITNGTIDSIDQATGNIYYTLESGYAVIKWQYVSENLLDDLMNIASGQLTGNKTFILSFTIFNTDFSYNCKLVSLQFTSRPNEVPTLQMGLQR